MNENSTIGAYNQALETLLHESIEKVEYYGIEGEVPFFDYDHYHSIDHGIQLTMASGKSCYFIWSEQYQAFDLKFNEGSILTEFPKEFPPPAFNQTIHKKWLPYIGKRITATHPHWAFVHYQNNAEKVQYPQEVVLQFEGNQVLTIAAVEVSDDGSIIPMADNITIFFGIDTTKNK